MGPLKLLYQEGRERGCLYLEQRWLGGKDLLLLAVTSYNPAVFVWR